MKNKIYVRALLFLVVLYGLSIFSPTSLVWSVEFVRVETEASKKSGRTSQLLQKLITKKRTQIKNQPDDKIKGNGEFVSSFSIFYHVETDRGEEEQNGYFRVANKNGKVYGWVDKEDVIVWRTRYAIKPRPPRGERIFKVKCKPGSPVATAEYDPADIVKGFQQFFYILETGKADQEAIVDSDGPFEGLLATQQAKRQGADEEGTAIEAMDLEIVFVLEMTDFMKMTWGSEDKRPLIEFVKELANNFVDLIEDRKVENGGVSEVATRLGLVTYHDTNKDAVLKTPRIVQDLTDNVRGGWLAAVNNLKGHKIMGDNEEDGLSALDAAVSDITWKKNSSKHIVIIGYGSFQKNDQYEAWMPEIQEHFMDWLVDRDINRNPMILGVSKGNQGKAKEIWRKHFGHNSSGKTLQDIHHRAQPTTAGIDGDYGIMLGTKTIHALRIGKDLTEGVDPEFIAEAKRWNKGLMDNMKKDGVSKEEVFFEYLDLKKSNDPDKNKLAEYARYAFDLEFMEYLDKQAKKDYQDATRGRVEGHFAAVPPRADAVQVATAKLQEKIQTAIGLISDIANQKDIKPDDTKGNNQFTEFIYKCYDASGARVLAENLEFLEGTAYTRSADAGGREIGDKAIMVEKKEMTRLAETFRTLHAKFTGGQEQDLQQLLRDLQNAVAGAAAGQDLNINANTKLHEFISDLPLRTKVLGYSANQIQRMLPSEYEAWVEELQVAAENAQDLLDDPDQGWLPFSSLDNSSGEYAFVLLNRLP